MTKVYPVIHHLDRSTSIEQARIADEAGADGVFLISHGGQNDELVPLVREIKLLTQLRVGVNFLGWSNCFALGAAHQAHADMLWLDAPGVNSAGLTREGEKFVHLMRLIAPKDRLEVFGSVAFKYQLHESNPARAALAASAFGFIPTTSGPATGKPPTVEKICDMAAECKTLAIASGMTLENVGLYSPYLTHVLVATGVSIDEHRFDFERLRAFVGRVHGSPKLSAKKTKLEV